MTAPGSALDAVAAASSGDAVIGLALEADLDAIVALESDGFDDGRWSRASWADALASGRGRVLVARAGGEVAGVAALSHVAGVADLDRVVVRSDHRRRGLGRRLVLAGLDWSASVGAGRVLLEVDAANVTAVTLYERLGFVAVGRRPGYYGPGRDALVMELDGAGGGQR